MLGRVGSFMTLFMSDHPFPRNQAKQNKQTRFAQWQIEFILLRPMEFRAKT